MLKISIPCERQLKFWKRIKDSSLIDSGQVFFGGHFWQEKNPSFKKVGFLHGGINHWSEKEVLGNLLKKAIHFASCEASQIFPMTFHTKL